MEILIVIFVAVLAAMLGWFLAKVKFTSEKGVPKEEVEKLHQQINEINIVKSVAEEKVAGLQQDIILMNEKYSLKEKELIQVSKDYAGSHQDNVNLKQKLEEQKAEITELQVKFTNEFENLANRIFDEKSSKFTEQNKENLKTILNPLGEKIKDFEKKVEETYEKESRDRTSLGGEIKKLFEMNQLISKEAQNLSVALKGQAKTQGNWGEIILESLLEKSGLVKDREYFIQKSFTNEIGKRLQPDVVIKFPGNRDIIVDSKVSLNAYERFSSAETKEEQEKALKEHVISVKKHIDELSGKKYEDISELKSLEFVFMFIPIEPAYYSAIQGDSQLWSYAYEKRILLVSPTNLFAVLKMTEKLWQQEYQSQNAFDIAKRSGELYDKFVTFVEDLQTIGRKINEAEKSYESAMNKLQDGRGNLISRAEKLKELGAKAKKSLPIESFVDSL
ncbi:MAG: DNA recombination protein RmuC [bacterium]